MFFKKTKHDECSCNCGSPSEQCPTTSEDIYDKLVDDTFDNSDLVNTFISIVDEIDKKVLAEQCFNMGSKALQDIGLWLNIRYCTDMKVFDIEWVNLNNHEIGNLKNLTYNALIKYLWDILSKLDI